jgi:hypothetical protein
MKVGSSSGLTAKGATGGARGAGSAASFNLPGVGSAAAATSAARASGMTGVASLDALLALQRRRKAVGRAGRILDVLDDLRIAVIDGEVSPANLDRLMRAVRDQRDATDDPGLEGLLNEIETRAAVELAKLERANLAA